MKTLVPSGVGLPGVVWSALAAWILKVSHETPSKAVHSAQLLYGVDEYWNGDYPEGEPQ